MAHRIACDTMCNRCILRMSTVRSKLRKSSRMAPKVKERRRGKKEIHRDNLDTLRFYLLFSVVGTAVQILHLLYFHFVAETTTWWDGFFVVFGSAVHAVCQWALHRLSQPLLGPGGELLDAGSDLSDNYISEYVIDFVILTALLQGLSILTNLVWLFWLGVPGVLVYKVWRLLICPWISQGPPTGGGDGAGKKQKNKVKYLRR